MNDFKSPATTDSSAPPPTPVRPTSYLSFHLLFLGGVAVCFYFWMRIHNFWTAQTAAVIGLLAGQVALYVWRGVFKRALWPGGVLGDVGFFASLLSMALAVASQAQNELWWVRMYYTGMMFAVLPLGWALGLGIAAGILFLPIMQGWNELASYTLGDWFGAVYPVVLPAAIGLMLKEQGVANDEQARLIGELELAKKALEQARDREGELATLRERERLARDLHDTLGHQLVTLTVQLEAAQRVVAMNPARAAAMLEDMQKLSRASTEDLRKALDNLRSSGLGDRPLAAALPALCADAGKRLALAVACEVPAETDALPPLVAEVLWCVVQEGLTNIGRHAQARRVRVTMELLPWEIVLRVSDDGVGWPPDAEGRPGHYGLRGLRERVEGLGGTFTLATADDGGALLEARLPIIN